MKGYNSLIYLMLVLFHDIVNSFSVFFLGLKKNGSVMVILLFCVACKTASGQKFNSDTLKLTMAETEKIFLEKNLQLIAQKYNVDAAKALIIQAKLYSNPNINVSNVLYDGKANEWLPVDKINGEEAAQLTQLIILSRKVNKQVKIAETNYKIAGHTFYSVLLSLKFALRTSFYNLYHLEKTAEVYNEEINTLKTINDAYQTQEGKGYIAETDLVRVQAQLYALQSEYQVLVDSINDQQSQIRLLLRASPAIYIKPIEDTALLNAANPLAYSLSQLLDSANKNRTDVLLAEDNLTLSQQNYVLQKALSVPDLSASAGYDKQGSYINNYNYIGLGIDIPIFNRNQGNIKNAYVMLDYNKTQVEIARRNVEEQVTRGLQKAVDADKLYRGINPGFASHFDALAKAMADNYMKRNIKLLDFLTFYDSYKQNIVQLNTIMYNRESALESLNFLTGTTFYNK